MGSKHPESSDSTLSDAQAAEVKGVAISANLAFMSKSTDTHLSTATAATAHDTNDAGESHVNKQVKLVDVLIILLSLSKQWEYDIL